MKFYCFAPARTLQKLEKERIDLFAVLNAIASATDTRDLVVSLYLLESSRWFGGTAYVRSWITPRQFYARRGKWRIYPLPPLPADLPAQFKLIRLALPAVDSIYPLREKDSYHWHHTYQSFSDHLAFIFAHELHHFRRFHLHFHPHEGEHSANAWALQRVRQCGFRVDSVKPVFPKRKPRSRANPDFIKLLNPLDFLYHDDKAFFFDWPGMVRRILVSVDEKTRKKYIMDKLHHIEQLRKLPVGTSVWISFDPSKKYLYQPVKIVRSPRRHAYRVVIETSDKKIWRWPMSWLSQRNPVSARH
ncbi:MAG: hypothetical protein JW976_08990 [Syntrophaceae bacterium]|nr:hypothetical protein [Syntrophaceae bacterium]